MLSKCWVERLINGWPGINRTSACLFSYHNRWCCFTMEQIVSICLSSCFSLESSVSVSQASSVSLFSRFLYFISPLSFCFSFLFCVIFCILRHLASFSLLSFVIVWLSVCSLSLIKGSRLISFPGFMTPQKVKRLWKEWDQALINSQKYHTFNFI